MRKILMFIVILSVFGCSKETIDTTPLTFDHFQNHLQPEMDYAALVDVFGAPTKDIGSGIHIYVYELSDSTEIWIGYVDEIIYARHVDDKGQLLDTII